jgi:3-deoxy-manno-octulosonate cytidylyltransferase (CMP-KDO synthetase)
MASTGILCVIPSRYGSTRLPGKPLILFKGIPLVMWVYNRAVEAGVFDSVCVATDDRRIAEAVQSRGGTAYMTAGEHASGTDRAFEVAQRNDYPYIVNLQGDEPCIPSGLLREFAANLSRLDDNSLLTCVSNATIDDKDNPNAVKAVLNNRREALYFSRAAIPYDRDQQKKGVFVHWGIYGFTGGSLRRFCTFPQGELEQRERLEQLRALEHGMRILCLVTPHKSCGVDTPEDVQKLRRLLEG